MHSHKPCLTAAFAIVWLFSATASFAQQPFSTDDAAVTAPGAAHIEVFDEHDWLQPSQRPHQRQNTINMRLNVGVGGGLELDVDAPLITIVNEPGTVPRAPFGIGDTNFGVKYNFHEEHPGAAAPAMSTAFYVETPNGDSASGLGSGVVDLWMYLVVQKSLGERVTLRINGGYLFTGNTSTGVVGIETVHGHIATGGASIVTAVTADWTLGVEMTAAASNAAALDRQQLQVLAGGTRALGHGLSVNVAVVAGHFVASPRFGLLVGAAWDVPRR